MPENKRKKFINIDDANAWGQRESEIEEEKILNDPYYELRYNRDEDFDEDIGGDYNADDGKYLQVTPRVKLLEEHCSVLVDAIEKFVDLYYRDTSKYEDLSFEYCDLLSCNDVNEWTDLMNSILEYIDKEIGFDEIKKFIPNKKTLEYLKRKEKSFNIGKAKLEKLVSKEKKLSDDTVKNKIVQDKLSQKD